MHNLVIADDQNIIKDIRILIETTKNRVAKTINSEMTMLYWQIGKRINQEILGDQRAEYGKEVIKSLAKVLSVEYGKGFTYTALSRMSKFNEQFAIYEIVATVSQQLSWSHIIELIPIKEDSKREFYAFMSIQENWSVRQLRSNIHKMSYERTIGASDITETSKQKIIKQSEIGAPKMLLKDPYILDVRRDGCYKILGPPKMHLENYA